MIRETLVHVGEASQVDDYTEYSLEIHHGDFTWTVNHRYSEFKELHDVLRSKDSSLEKSLLPPKKLFGKMSPSFVDKRRKELEHYLQILVQQKYASAFPRPLKQFMNFHLYDVEMICQGLAENFFHNGDRILETGSVYTFSPLELWCITERLASEKPPGDVEDPKYDFGHVLDFVQKLKHLHINCKKGNIHASDIIAEELQFDLMPFHALQQLVVDGCGPAQIPCFTCLHRTLSSLSIHQSLTRMQRVLTGDYGDDAFIAWTNLITADFSNNEITSIDTSVKVLTCVEFLDLSKNKITNIENLEHLSSLTFLDLSSNLIEDVSLAHTKLGNVKTLNLSHNQLKSLRGLGKLYALEFLDVSQNHIAEIIEVDYIAKLPCASKLNLSNNPLARDFDYRTKTLSRFGSRACEIRLDSIESTQKELDTAAVLHAILKSRKASISPRDRTLRYHGNAINMGISSPISIGQKTGSQIIKPVMSAPGRLHISEVQESLHTDTIESSTCGPQTTLSEVNKHEQMPSLTNSESSNVFVHDDESENRSQPLEDRRSVEENVTGPQNLLQEQQITAPVVELKSSESSQSLLDDYKQQGKPSLRNSESSDVINFEEVSEPQPSEHHHSVEETSARRNELLEKKERDILCEKESTTVKVQEEDANFSSYSQHQTDINKNSGMLQECTDEYSLKESVRLVDAVTDGNSSNSGKVTITDDTPLHESLQPNLDNCVEETESIVSSENLASSLENLSSLDQVDWSDNKEVLLIFPRGSQNVSDERDGAISDNSVESNSESREGNLFDQSCVFPNRKQGAKSLPFTFLNPQNSEDDAVKPIRSASMNTEDSEVSATTRHQLVDNQHITLPNEMKPASNSEKVLSLTSTQVSIPRTIIPEDVVVRGDAARLNEEEDKLQSSSSIAQCRFTVAPVMYLDFSSPALHHLSNLPPSQLHQYFRTIVKNDVNETLHHVTWCVVVFYQFPDVEVPCAVFVSNLVLYLVADKREILPLPSATTYNSLENLKHLSNLSVTRLPLASETESRRLSQVVVGLFKQCVRLTGSTLNDTVTLAMRSSTLTDDFIASLVDGLNRTNQVSVSNDVLSVLEHSELLEDLDVIHPQSGVHFTICNEEAMTEFNFASVEIQEKRSNVEGSPGGFQLILYCLVHCSSTESGYVPMTFVLTSDYCCICKEDIVSYPLPDFTLTPPEYQRFRDLQVASLVEVKCLQLDDIVNCDVSIVINPVVTVGDVMTADVEKVWRLVFRDYYERERIIRLISERYEIVCGKSLCVNLHHYST